MIRKRQKKHRSSRAQWFHGREGIAFVRCRICGKHLRVISGRHLSKHGIDRETYMHQYRLSPDELIATDFREIQSSRRGYYPYGKSDWIAAIKGIYKRDGQVFAGYLQDKYPHLYNQGTWLFGDWDNALCAAGFMPDKMRLWAYWDQQKVIEQIQRLRKNNTPLYAKYVMKKHTKLFSAAGRQFGSWGKALLVAGITTPKYALGARGCIGFLQTLRDALGRGSENDLPQPLKSSAVYYFGSLRKAVLATKGEGVGESTTTNIKIVLCRMHRTKQSLVYMKARRQHLPLVRAAEKHFGSWGKALHAAGIDPNLYYVHRKWRGAKLSSTGEGMWPAT